MGMDTSGQGMKSMTFWFLAILVLGVMAYIRHAPSDPTQWHVPIFVTENATYAGGAERFVAGDPGPLMQKLDQIIQSEPRSTQIAGQAEDGHVTYVVRTRWMGYPDYVTVQSTQNGIQIYSRLRFGKSDLGVNANRLDRWIAQLN